MTSMTNKNTRLEKRSVVSSFIVKRVRTEKGHTQTKVALFKRSGQVNTYRHHWAPISGGIEAGTDASPLAAAWRELAEETTLTETSLELLRHGKSYVFADPSVGREWAIYPFLYQLKPGAKDMEIDWEHEEWAWFSPADVKDTAAFGGVPHLATSLRRVWFEYDLGDAPGSAGALLKAGLGVLRNDYQSGARQLAGVALGILLGVVRALPTADTDMDAWWTQVRFAAWHIWKNGRESMGAAIMSVLLDALATIEKGLGRNKGTLHNMRDEAAGVLDSKIAARASSSSAGPVADALLGYLEQTVPALSTPTAPRTLTILTLSESSTIAYFLQQLALKLPPRFKSVDLRVLESRPLYEGVSMAASLAQFIRENSPGELHF